VGGRHEALARARRPGADLAPRNRRPARPRRGRHHGRGHRHGRRGGPHRPVAPAAQRDARRPASGRRGTGALGQIAFGTYEYPEGETLGSILLELPFWFFVFAVPAALLGLLGWSMVSLV